jgi:hypothetical protein
VSAGAIKDHPDELVRVDDRAVMRWHNTRDADEGPTPVVSRDQEVVFIDREARDLLRLQPFDKAGVVQVHPASTDSRDSEDPRASGLIGRAPREDAVADTE